jgi:hypothetical protein
MSFILLLVMCAACLGVDLYVHHRTRDPESSEVIGHIRKGGRR